MQQNTDSYLEVEDISQVDFGTQDINQNQHQNNDKQYCYEFLNGS